MYTHHKSQLPTTVTGHVATYHHKQKHVENVQRMSLFLIYNLFYTKYLLVVLVTLHTTIHICMK